MTETQPPDRSDADLVAAIATVRDRDAFQVLYHRFAPRVTALLLRRKAAAAAAAEITQEVMLVAWRRAETYDARRASVAAWIFTIARNRYIDRIRRERRPEVHPDDPVLVTQDRSPDSNLDAERRAGQVRRAWARLPEEQARLIQLAYFEGKSHRDIAELEGLALGTVKSRFRLAMKRLRTLMQAPEGEE